MTTYDFTKLNDKEFEALSIDILSKMEGCHIERFKSGKDDGIDGRFFSTDGKETIIQCKHYIKSGIANLIKHLEEKELKKIKKLDPKRYILATSLPLSPNNKRKIKDALSPYIKYDSDIIGEDEISDSLSKNHDIERRHYKLWIPSSNTILTLLNNGIYGRSEFKLEQIKNSISRYVVTSNHDKAVKKLDDKRCLIITGSPGIGKTTLADQILLQYASQQDFEVCCIENSINEAEAIFVKDKKQIFYFDDFLGSVILDSFSKREDYHIVTFIKRITNDISKRFILTSRTVILNDAKNLSERFQIENIDENEYEVQIRSLLPIDKAKILYNHIWHSSLTEDYIDELYYDKRYRKIIDHRNYNPRLISFITDPKRLTDVPSSDYWQYIQKTLDDPSGIWDHVFNKQITPLCLMSVYFVTLNGREIRESDLRSAFSNMAIEEDLSRTSGVENDFEKTIKTAVGSVLNRKLDSITKKVRYSLFDPSIGDYVIKKVSQNSLSLKAYFKHLNSVESLQNLESLFTNKVIDKIVFSEILESIIKSKIGSNKISFSYKVKLSNLSIKNNIENITIVTELKSFLPHLQNNSKPQSHIEEICNLYIWYINKKLIESHSEYLINLISYFLSISLEDEEYGSVSNLIRTMLKTDCESDYDLYLKLDKSVNQLKNKLLKDWQSTIDQRFGEYFDYEAYGEENILERIHDFIADRLFEIGFDDFSDDDISSIAEFCDIDALFKANREIQDDNDLKYENWKESRHHFVEKVDPIDDLFSRNC